MRLKDAVRIEIRDGLSSALYFYAIHVFPAPEEDLLWRLESSLCRCLQVLYGLHLLRQYQWQRANRCLPPRPGGRSKTSGVSSLPNPHLRQDRSFSSANSARFHRRVKIPDSSSDVPPFLTPCSCGQSLTIITLLFVMIRLTPENPVKTATLIGLVARPENAYSIAARSE